MANWKASERKIQRVPSFLRDKSDAYEPKVVSFGPYHHGKPELQFCQNAKDQTLKMFVEGSGHTREFFKREVGKVVAYARSCYVEGSTDEYTDKEFVEMMLLDACFLIFFVGVVDKSNRGHFFPIYSYMGRLVGSMINRDMFLVENQIPFRVVMQLINLRYNKENGEEALARLLHQSIWGTYSPVQQVSEETLQDQNRDIRRECPLHILEAFHRVLVWDFTRTSVGPLQDTAWRSRYKSFRSANDLKSKRIYLKPSETRSLKSINFKSFTFSGQLELPVMSVTHLDKVVLPNMIAYELSPCSIVDTTVSSYVAFMKSLIETPADVKELRERKVLLTTLGSDEEVMQLYRNLETFEMEDVFRFMDVKRLIQEHYDSKAKTWRAELIHTYLSSPWSIIAWLAALLLLILTFLQTYFTITK